MKFFTLVAMMAVLSAPVFAEHHEEGKAKEVFIGSATVLFEFDDNKILDEATRTSIREAGKIVKDESARVRVEGFADERGTTEYNRGLAQRRINTVVGLLKEGGADDSVIDQIIYGEDPSTAIYDGHAISMGVGPNQGWAADRRVSFHVYLPE